MPSAFRIGARVRHRDLGRGEVIAEKHDGEHTLVAFERGAQWVESADLLSEVAMSAAEDAVRAEEDETEGSARIHQARAIIEAMRLGIAPPTGIERCTVGRRFEVATIRDWLRDEAEGVLVLEGEYGAGKSHLLSYLRRDAHAVGFAVAALSVDPTEGVLTVPRRAYAHLIRDLSVPVDGHLLGFEEAIRLAARNPRIVGELQDHHYFGPALGALAGGKLPEATWEVLRGERTRAPLTPPLYEHQTAANLVSYLLSGLGVLLTEAFQLRGLLLLFDEVETAPSTRYGYERLHAKNLLKGLTLVASDEEVALEEQVERRGGSSFGAQTHLLYSGHLGFRYLYSIPSRLKCLFAVTPDTLLPVFREWRSSLPRLSVAPLDEKQQRALYELTCSLYGEAYGMPRPDAASALFDLARSRALGDHPRRMLKATVEVLDFLRFHQGVDPRAHL